MFNVEEKEVVGMNIAHPPKSGPTCDSWSPDERWICTKETKHGGMHRAGTGVWSWGAEWDDNRSTD